MTDAAVRMCVTRESSREEEVRESRREELASAARHEIVRLCAPTRVRVMGASYEMDASVCMCVAGMVVVVAPIPVS